MRLDHYLISFYEYYSHTHAQTRTHMHARAHTHTHMHASMHALTHTHTWHWPALHTGSQHADHHISGQTPVPTPFLCPTTVLFSVPHSVYIILHFVVIWLMDVQAELRIPEPRP